jgi:hypothetical protein
MNDVADSLLEFEREGRFTDEDTEDIEGSTEKI